MSRCIVHNKPVEKSETQVLELLSWALHTYIGSTCILVPEYCEFVLTATFTSRVFVAPVWECGTELSSDQHV